MICPVCHGVGKYMGHACPECWGTGAEPATAERRDQRGVPFGGTLGDSEEARRLFQEYFRVPDYGQEPFAANVAAGQSGPGTYTNTIYENGPPGARPAARTVPCDYLVRPNDHHCEWHGLCQVCGRSYGMPVTGSVNGLVRKPVIMCGPCLENTSFEVLAALLTMQPNSAGVYADDLIVDNRGELTIVGGECGPADKPRGYATAAELRRYFHRRQP